MKRKLSENRGMKRRLSSWLLKRDGMEGKVRKKRLIFKKWTLIYKQASIFNEEEEWNSKRIEK